MGLDNLFKIVDSLAGDVASFKGLLFTTDNGLLIIDVYETGRVAESFFLCEYASYDESIEPISFAAVNIDELKEQLEYYLN